MGTNKTLLKKAGEIMKKILFGALFIATAVSANSVSDFEARKSVNCETLSTQNSDWATSGYYKCGKNNLDGEYLVYTFQNKKIKKLKSKFCANGVSTEYQNNLIGWDYKCLNH
jgi:hypothetical protein